MLPSVPVIGSLPLPLLSKRDRPIGRGVKRNRDTSTSTTFRVPSGSPSLVLGSRQLRVVRECSPLKWRSEDLSRESTPPVPTEIRSYSITDGLCPDSPAKRHRPEIPSPSSSLTGVFLSEDEDPPPPSPIPTHSPLRKSFSTAVIPTVPHSVSPLAMVRSVTTPTTRTKQIHTHIDGVESLGEEMDKVFALVHGRGLRTAGGERRRRESGLRHGMGAETMVDGREAGEIEIDR